MADEKYEKEINGGIFMLNFIKPRAGLGFRTPAKP